MNAETVAAARDGGDPFPPAEAARSLLRWFSSNARRMEWRETSDPYRVWLSEIMLQQTRVATVLPYYRRFLEAFPDVRSLADAPDDRLMKLWEGLGYYSRARNLLRCARIVTREHGGIFPSDPYTLESLPGIGRSTAGAIAAIAFGRDVPILDGNVKRVVARLGAVGDGPAPAASRSRMWELSERMVLPGRGRDTALAMMDLGATVCTPRRPRCSDCPLARWCRALAAGNPESYPAKEARKPRPVREAVAALVRDRRGRILIRRRPEGGLLGGLWEFPGAFLDPGESPEAALRRWGRESGVPTLRPVAPAGTVRHALTHFELVLHGWHCTAGRASCADGERWVAAGDLPNHAFPRAHRKLGEQGGLT